MIHQQKNFTYYTSNISSSTDNIPVFAAVATRLNHTNDSQSLIERTKPFSIYINTSMNFATATSMENTLSREQAKYSPTNMPIIYINNPNKALRSTYKIHRIHI